MLELKTTWQNDNPNTIYNKLAAKIGRQPTHDEVIADMRRIRDTRLVESASNGKLWFQKK